MNATDGPAENGDGAVACGGASQVSCHQSNVPLALTTERSTRSWRASWTWRQRCRTWRNSQDLRVLLKSCSSRLLQLPQLAGKLDVETVLSHAEALADLAGDRGRALLAPLAEA